MNTSACVSVCVSVCLSICLSARISPEPHSRSLLNFLCTLPCGRGSVLLWQGGELTSARGTFEGFLPIDNALYSIVFGTHTKTAEAIEMPLAMMTRVGRRYHMLDGGSDPQRELAFFAGWRSGAL